MKSTVLSVSRLKADPHNRRAHPTRNQEMLRSALEELGAARSIVINEDDVVLAGNGVVDAAAAVGIRKVKVIDADGDTLIAVRRSGLTPDQQRRLAMFDNRTGELAEWNAEQLALDRADGLDIGAFFSDKEIEHLLAVPGLAELRRNITIARPAEIVWVLVALPIAKWPAHQAAVEALQRDGVFTGSAIRAKGK